MVSDDPYCTFERTFNACYPAGFLFLVCVQPTPRRGREHADKEHSILLFNAFANFYATPVRALSVIVLLPLQS